MLYFGFRVFPILASSHGLFVLPLVHLSSQIGPGEPYAYGVPGSESKLGANEILPFLQGLVLSSHSRLCG